CAGETVNAQRARELGIVFDAVASERLLDEAKRLVQWAYESNEWEALRRRKRQPVGLSEDQHSYLFAVARAQVLAKTKGQLPAPLAALDAIEKGCNLPLDEGLRIESATFAPLIGSPISRNLIAVFFMTQRLQKDPGVADADVCIEATIEHEAATLALYRQLEPLLRPDAILASNTSTISITRMAQSVKHPEQFAGMHFFNPVDRMQLVEVIRGERTSDETVVTLVALAKRIGKTPIVVRDCPGFLVNRILFPYLNESLVLLEEGARPRAIDKAAATFGMPMGPITLNDVVGLDTSLFAGQVINTAFADRAKTTHILGELVGAGRLGQKSGAGFYSYTKGARGADDPAFAAILERCRTAHRKIEPDES